MKRTLRQRLEAKIDKTLIDGHWIWTGTFTPSRPKRERRAFIRTSVQVAYAANRNPRPVITINGKREQALRLIWKEFVNPDLPDGVYIRKIKAFCTYYQCVNPNCHNTPPRRLPRIDMRAVVPPSQQNLRETAAMIESDIQDLADEIEGRYGANPEDVDALAEEFGDFTRPEILAALGIIHRRN